MSNEKSYSSDYSVASSYESSEDEIDNYQEDSDAYCRGGYHPVKIGDLYKRRYYVIRKLGWGYYATVWLCWDSSKSSLVALKVTKSEKTFFESAVREILSLKLARESNSELSHVNNTVKLLDYFELSGCNGTHICMVFEMLGDDLFTLVQNGKYGYANFKNVKSTIRQILYGLHYLHDKCNIIHTDVKLENVLVCVDRERINKLAVEALERKLMRLPQPIECVANISADCDDDFENSATTQAIDKMLVSMLKPNETSEAINNCSVNGQTEFLVKIGDLGTSCRTFQHLSEEIQTRQYRSPEIILGIPYNETVDIWSTACLAFALATATYLFDPKPSENCNINDNHLAAFIGVLGPIPNDLIKRGTRSKEYFDAAGTLERVKKFDYVDLTAHLVKNFQWKKEDAEEFTNFLFPMLEYDPEKRVSVASCLEHPFLKC